MFIEIQMISEQTIFIYDILSTFGLTINKTCTFYAFDISYKNKNPLPAIQIINMNTVIKSDSTFTYIYHDDDDLLFDYEWIEVQAPKQAKRVNSISQNISPKSKLRKTK